MMSSRHPMFLWWGPDLVQIYNDGYLPSFGASGRDIAALGARGRDHWAEIWPTIGPEIDRVMTFGEASWHVDQLVPIERNGRLEDVWWTYGYSPVRDDDGSIGGTLVVVQETTSRMLALAEARRLRVHAESARDSAEAARLQTEQLRALSAALAIASTPDEVAAAVVLHAGAVFGAVGVIMARANPAEERLEIMQVTDLSDALRAEWQLIPMSARVPLTDVARSGEPLFIASRVEWMELYPQLEVTLEVSGHRANAVVPLLADGRVLGVLGAAFATSRNFAEEERSLIFTVAAQCAQALERARLFEAERIARRDAELANRSKSEFLAVMSHELRTPLNAIGGYADLIELGIHGPITPEQAKALARIQWSQRHLLGLINGVLNYSRVEAGAVHYSVSDVPVDEVLATCEALITPLVRAKRLQFSYEGCDESLLAHADREKVQQVVLNLLSNAVKFTEPGGSVRMECVRSGVLVEVRVTDTGRGIPADQLERIFHPFVQVDARLTRTQEGTGLGLAISRDLARGMGGDLTVESTENVGSLFTLSLPIA